MLHIKELPLYREKGAQAKKKKVVRCISLTFLGNFVLQSDINVNDTVKVFIINQKRDKAN